MTCVVKRPRGDHDLGHTVAWCVFCVLNLQLIFAPTRSVLVMQLPMFEYVVARNAFSNDVQYQYCIVGLSSRFRCLLALPSGLL